MQHSSAIHASTPDPRTATGLARSAWRVLAGGSGRYFWASGPLLAALALLVRGLDREGLQLPLIGLVVGMYAAASQMSQGVLHTAQALRALRVPRWHGLIAASMLLLTGTLLVPAALVLTLHDGASAAAPLQLLLLAYALGAMPHARAGRPQRLLSAVLIMSPWMVWNLWTPGWGYTLLLLGAVAAAGFALFRHALRHGNDATRAGASARAMFRRRTRAVIATDIVTAPSRLLPDARKVGPDFPAHSLRLFLGGALLPRPWWRQVLRVLLPLLVLLVAVIAGARQHWSGGVAVVAPLLVVAGTCVEAARGLAQLSALLANRSADLAELALLPGQGDATRARRHLLQATLWPALRRALATALIGIGACALGRAPGTLLALLAAWSALALLAGQGALLGILSSQAVRAPRHARRRWAFWLRASAVLAALGMLARISQWLIFPRPGLPGPLPLAALFALTWLCVAAVLAWHLRERWLRLQRLPHPFLQR